MRQLKVIAITLLLCAISFQTGRAETFTLPTGAKVTIVSMGPVHAGPSKPSLELRYRSGVGSSDRSALHGEALEIWRVFQLYAEEGGYDRAVLSPTGGPAFAFHKEDGLWSEDGVRVPALTGEMRKAAWALGTWHCTESFAQEDNKVAYRVTGINQVDPTGTLLEGNRIFHSPIGTMFSFSDLGYDAHRNVWFSEDKRGNITVKTETTDSNSRTSHSFGSVTIAGYPPVYFRTTAVVSTDQTSVQEHGEVQIKGLWHPFDRSTCSRSNATPAPDNDDDPSI